MAEPLSLARKTVVDFLHASATIPLIPLYRDLDLQPLLAARQACPAPRASFCSLFTKGYAKVVAKNENLRRAFLSFPRERLLTYERLCADVVISTILKGEEIVFPAPIQRPDARPLRECDQLLEEAGRNPLGVKRYARARTLARFPRLVRRGLWWFLTQVSEKGRQHYLGTFGVTSVSNVGVEHVRPIAPWTTTLHYGVVQPNGKCRVWLTFDHRVMDGLPAARALGRLEEVLNTELVRELEDLRLAGSFLAKAG